MPMIGLGTGGDGLTMDNVYQMVKDGIDAGYRHFDTAYIYHNEVAVGSAINEMIANGKIKREDVFIVTKIWNTYHSRAKVTDAIQMALADLDLGYIDLLLMNWPMGYKEGTDDEPVDTYNHIIPSTVDFVDTWKEMEQSVTDGSVKSIGLSNFNSKQITRLLQSALIKPVVNQIESHPTLTQKPLIDFCKLNGIEVTAYSPLGGGKLLDKTQIIDIAEKHGKSAAQVMIKYQIQRGVSVIPRSVHKDKLAENLDVFDFELTANEMTKIDEMNVDFRYYDEIKAEKHQYYPFVTPY